MQKQRIQDIRDAATRLFLQQGYAKTQVSHIARAVGVSVGTIYHDFTCKEAIMHYILQCTIEPEFIDRELEYPITDEVFINLNDKIMAVFEKSAEEFSQNLERAGDTYDFEDMISDAFDLLDRYAVGCLFIEKNYMDCGPLAEQYKVYRRKFFLSMLEYMNVFIKEGIVRSLKYVDLTTNLIIETLTWWAMDMRYISFETHEIPIEQAKEVCMDNIISAYKIK